MERFDSLIKKEEQLAHGELIPENRNQLQIYLAVKLFEKLTGEIVHFENHNQRDDAIVYWKEKGYSKAFADFENSEVFKRLIELPDKFKNITLEAFEEFVKNIQLQE